MKNEKNIYVSPSVEVYNTSCEDVIATSGFNGDDHIIGNNKQKGIYEL